MKPAAHRQHDFPPITNPPGHVMHTPLGILNDLGGHFPLGFTHSVAPGPYDTVALAHFWHFPFQKWKPSAHGLQSAARSAKPLVAAVPSGNHLHLTELPTRYVTCASNDHHSLVSTRTFGHGQRTPAALQVRQAAHPAAPIVIVPVPRGAWFARALAADVPHSGEEICGKRAFSADGGWGLARLVYCTWLADRPAEHVRLGWAYRAHSRMSAACIRIYGAWWSG